MTLAEIIKAARAPAEDRCERYARRLDTHLATLPTDMARLAFVRRELANWQDRYTAFCDFVDRGGDPGDRNAFNYQITISDLEIRKSRLERDMRA